MIIEGAKVSAGQSIGSSIGSTRLRRRRSDSRRAPFGSAREMAVLQRRQKPHSEAEALDNAISARLAVLHAARECSQPSLTGRPGHGCRPSL